MKKQEGKCEEGMTHAEELVAMYNLGAAIEREGITEYMEEIAWEYDGVDENVVRVIHEFIIPWLEENVTGESSTDET
jgi:hypothetical protein